MALRAASQLDVKAGTATDALSAAIEMDFPTWLISAECWENSLDLTLTYDGTNYFDAFEVDPDRPILFPFQAVACKVQNNEAGKNSRYQIAGIV